MSKVLQFIVAASLVVVLSVSFVGCGSKDGKISGDTMKDGKMADHMMAGEKMTDGKMADHTMAGGKMTDGKTAGEKMADHSTSDHKMSDSQGPAGH